MNVEYTGRQYEVTNAIRKEVETGLTKIRKILGDKFETKVILAVEKHRHKAEITPAALTRNRPGYTRLADLEGRLRCRNCGARGRASLLVELRPRD